jgi:rubredoxin
MNRYQCPNCSYVYDEACGEPAQGFPAQTQWQQIPDDWACPDCAVRDKVDFVEASREQNV